MSSTNQTATVSNSVFEQIEQAAQSKGKFLKIQPGQSIVLKFDTNKIKLINRTIENKTSQAVEYTVINVNDGQEKILTLSLSWAMNLNELLKAGYVNVKISRRNGGLDTTYSFLPV